MKLKNYFYAFACTLAVVTVVSSCDDEDKWDASSWGSKVDMAETRAFVLNEGSYGLNNSSIGYFDFRTDAVYSGDLFVAQNGTSIGDTGQDLIEEDDYLYLAVYGSNYISKLNGVGKEVGRLSLASDESIGAVRYLAADDGYLYATTYGGYVIKVNTSNMTIVGKVEVGRNPEQIIEEDGYIYCVNSGWGDDNRLAIIDERTFSKADFVDIIYNPQAIVETDGYIAIQGYGADYSYPVIVYDRTTKTYSTIGQGTNIAAEDGILYVANTQTDYSVTPYSSTTSFYTYNFRTKQKNEHVFSNVPSSLTNSAVYGISVNDETGHVYVLGTNYTWGDGTVYHFDQNGNYIGSFSSYGQNPKKVVFVD